MRNAAIFCIAIRPSIENCRLTFIGTIQVQQHFLLDALKEELRKYRTSIAIIWTSILPLTTGCLN
jgi:hypothetical protein